MNNDSISPKYLMTLIDKIAQGLDEEFATYQKIENYIRRWHEHDDYSWQNFSIVRSKQGLIDSERTLHGMEGELLLKIAIDLGIETPDYIPSIPVFKNDLKANFQSAFDSFQKALKQVEDNPDVAIGLANSTLEAIIKEILKDGKVNVTYDKNKTLYSLTQDILKAFQIYPDNSLPEEIRTIGSSLLNINKNIEKLRSEKTTLHGKTSEDILVTESIYAHFLINSISSIGLFISAFYKKNYPKEIKSQKSIEEDDLPF